MREEEHESQLWRWIFEGGRGVWGAVGRGSQSAFRESLLDLIQHIPQQRWLVALGVDGDGLIRLEDEDVALA